MKGFIDKAKRKIKKFFSSKNCHVHLNELLSKIKRKRKEKEKEKKKKKKCAWDRNKFKM